MAAQPVHQAPTAEPGRQSSRFRGQPPDAALWLETPFSVLVRGISKGGKGFKLHTVLDGLSPSYLSLRLLRPVDVGQRLFAVIDLNTPSEPGQPRACIAVRALVMQSEELPGETWRVMAGLTRHRFLTPARCNQMPRQ